MKKISIIEKYRYNVKNSKQSETIDYSCVGPDAIDILHRAPYAFLDNYLSGIVNKDSKVLDVCCGDGLYSFMPLKYGGTVEGIDISEKAIEIGRKRAEILNYSSRINFHLGDANSISFENDSFDVIMCIGSLSYLDQSNIHLEFYRLLKPNGYVILLDSLNHNIFYRLNRLIQVLLGKRSFYTYKNMPDVNTIERFGKNFDNVNTIYFGKFDWLFPMLSLFLNINICLRLINKLDSRLFYSKKWAFKFVAIRKKII